MKAARVLLLWPGSVWADDHVRRHVPVKLPLLALFSYLRHHHVEVEVLDLHTELGRPQPDREAVEAYYRAGLRLLEARTFDVLAISCWTSFDYVASCELARRVRDRDPAVVIVVGGYHPTAEPDDFTGPGSPFDAVVRGEGEAALLDIARHGLERTGHVPVIDGARLPMDEPYVDLEGFPYLESRPFKLDLAMSRGCPHQCAFCAGPSQGRSWRAYPVPVALQVARAALKLRPRVLDFLDPCFGSRASWRREFLAGLAATEPGAVISVQTRADSVTADDLDIMRRMDFYLQIGVETLSPAMAETMGKSRDGERYVRRAKRLLEDASDRDVLTLANIVVNHPGETPETLETTVDSLEAFVASRQSGLARRRRGRLRLPPRQRCRNSPLPLREEPTARSWQTPRGGGSPNPRRRSCEMFAPVGRWPTAAPWYDRLLAARLRMIERWSASAKLTAYRRRMPLTPDPGENRLPGAPHEHR